jgi:hypothetical protein
VQQTIAVVAKKASQTITFAALAQRTLAQSPVTVSATASSALTVSFTTTTPLVWSSSGADQLIGTYASGGHDLTCPRVVGNSGDPSGG